MAVAPTNTTGNASMEASAAPGGGSTGDAAGLVESVLAALSDRIYGRLIASVIIVVLAWGFVRVTTRALRRSAERHARRRRFDEVKVKGMVGRTKPVQMAVSLSVWVIAILALLAAWGLQTAFTGLLAGAGFFAIVLGLAAGDTIGDIIAGFLLFANHPFEIGDWVEVGGIMGSVEDVSLWATTILTFANEKVTVPNRLVEQDKIKNYSHARRLRRGLMVGVEYGSDLRAAMKIMEEAAAEHPEVFLEPAPSAIALQFGASSVDLEVRYWVEPSRPTVLRVQTDLIDVVHQRLRANGIVIAFPHMQVVQARPWQVSEAA